MSIKLDISRKSLDDIIFYGHCLFKSKHSLFKCSYYLSGPLKKGLNSINSSRFSLPIHRYQLFWLSSRAHNFVQVCHSISIIVLVKA